MKKLRQHKGAAQDIDCKRDGFVVLVFFHPSYKKFQGEPGMVPQLQDSVVW